MLQTGWFISLLFGIHVWSDFTWFDKILGRTSHTVFNGCRITDSWIASNMIKTNESPQMRSPKQAGSLEYLFERKFCADWITSILGSFLIYRRFGVWIQQWGLLDCRIPSMIKAVCAPFWLVVDWPTDPTQSAAWLMRPHHLVLLSLDSLHPESKQVQQNRNKCRVRNLSSPLVCYPLHILAFTMLCATLSGIPI